MCQPFSLGNHVGYFDAGVTLFLPSLGKPLELKLLATRCPASGALLLAPLLMPTLVSTPTHVPKPSTAQLPTTMLLPEPLPIRCHYLDTRPNPDACNLNHDTSRCRVQEPTAATASVPTLPTPAMPVPASLVVPMPVAPTPASPVPPAPTA
ncbi:unnamed protein product [Ilex paraguariensis]|uniref:Uncharacterized protein n=1 Tax=Ilex paraguariensis TaxID=185542 RepID=A0ABC8TJU4_9AQUA